MDENKMQNAKIERKKKFKMCSWPYSTSKSISPIPYPPIYVFRLRWQRHVTYIPDDIRVHATWLTQNKRVHATWNFYKGITNCFKRNSLEMELKISYSQQGKENPGRKVLDTVPGLPATGKVGEMRDTVSDLFAIIVVFP